MRRALPFALTLVLLAACHRTVGGPEAGTTTAQLAVAQFLNAAKAQDLQAMSAVWGDAESPVRDRAERQEVERRLMIMTCHLRHDESRIGPPMAGEDGRQIFEVELKQGAKTATSKFKTIKNAKSGRWFVETFELEPVRSFCTGQGTPRPAPPARALAR